MGGLWSISRHTVVQCIRTRSVVMFLLLLAVMLAVMPFVLTGDDTLAGKRAHEAARLGYSRIVLPRHTLPKEERPKGVEFVEVRTLGEAIDTLMGSRPRKRARKASEVPAGRERSLRTEEA